MSTVTIKGTPVHTIGHLPAVGTTAPAFTLCGGELSDVTLSASDGKVRLLNIVPSLDTGICALSAKRFNTEAAKLAPQGLVVLNISMDLPFAQKRFCSAEGVSTAQSLSAFRDPQFGKDYGVTHVDGPFRGLLSRSVVVVGRDGKVAYTQLVPEIGTEPDYNAALDAIKKLL